MIKRDAQTKLMVTKLSKYTGKSKTSIDFYTTVFIDNKKAKDYKGALEVMLAVYEPTREKK